MRDTNKLNQHIANISNRNADELILRPFVEWCAIAQTALEMQPKKKDLQGNQFVSSKRSWGKPLLVKVSFPLISKWNFYIRLKIPSQWEHYLSLSLRVSYLPGAKRSIVIPRLTYPASFVARSVSEPKNNFLILPQRILGNLVRMFAIDFRWKL